MIKRNKLLILVVLGLLIGGILIYQGISQSTSLSYKTSNQNVALPTTKPSEIPITQTPIQPSSGAVLSAKETKIPPNFVQAQVVRVVDGDTIEVALGGQNFKLRYIGVNTPETVDPRRPVQCFGKEASDENKKLLPPGQKIYLEKDISETDKFGRLLRYVYIPLDDGNFLMVNDYLVREGFAQIDTFPPDVKYVSRFTQAQTEARNGNKGLWVKCNGQI